MYFLRTFLIFSILLFTIYFSYSSVKNEKDTWFSSVQKAEKLLLEENYLDAEKNWLEAYSLSKSAVDSVRFNIKFHLLYTQAINKNYSFESLSLLEQANSLLSKFSLPAPELHEFYKLYYHCLGYNGQWNQALPIAQKSLSKHPLSNREDSIRLATLIHDIAFIFNKIGDFPSAIEHYNTSIDLYKKTHGHIHSDIALGYNNLAYNYGLMGMSQKQLQAYQDAANIWEQAELKDNSYLMTVYGNLMNWYHTYGNTDEMSGLLAKIKEQLENKGETWGQLNRFGNMNMSEKDLKTSLNFWNKSLKYSTILKDESLSLSLLDSTHTLIKKNKILQSDKYLHYLSSAYNDVSKMYFEKGELDVSNVFLLKSLNILKTYGYTGSLSDTHARLAKNYIYQKDYQQAQQHIDSAIAFNKDLITLSAYHVFSAQIADAQHQFSLAEKHYRQSITYLINKQSLSHNIQYLEPHHFEDRVILNDISTLNHAGHYFLRRYVQNQNVCYLEDAQHLFVLALEMLNRYYLGGVYTDVISSEQNSLQSGLLECQIHLSKFSSKKFSNSNLLEKIENNRSHHSWKKFIKNNHLFRQNITDSLNNYEESHKRMILFYQQKLQNTHSDSLQNQSSNFYKARLHEHQTALKTIENQLLSFHPEYKHFSSGKLSIHHLKNNLPSNTDILRYMVTDSMTYLFHISNHDIQIYYLGKTDSLLRWTDEALQAINERNDTYYTISQKLFQQLIAPIETRLKQQNLIIVPDRFLHHLPFEALSKSGLPQDFLIHRHHISYTPSLVLWQTQMKLPQIKNLSFAAFSPEYPLPSNSNQELPRPLKGAKEESKKISQLMDGHLYGGDTLNKQLFESQAPNYHILHLAMHTENQLDSDNQISFLLSNNSSLSILDIYSMRLKAQLAVLTSCNTAQGTWKNGEGVQSLANAFSFAGVSSLIMSLWTLPDKITSKISIDFYKNLKNGAYKNTALTQAKRKYLEEVQYEKESLHPYYWAGLVISGDTRPIANNKSIYWIWGAFLIFSIIIVFINYKNRM